MQDSIALVGLGNFGAKYALNRHNVGFMFIDYIAAELGIDSFKEKSKTLVCNTIFASQQVLLIKPKTFMNLSGVPLAEIIKFYKLHKDNIIVFHDDIDLPLAKVRYKVQSGSGGHNGVKSIHNLVGTDIKRIKIGVGSPPLGYDVSNYVLSNFVREELSMLEQLFSSMFTNIHYLLDCCFKEFIEKSSCSDHR